MDTVVRHLRRAVVRQDGAGRTDRQLLGSFLDYQDEAAFEALVRRHGSMVFGVCRRVVGNHHDAEDAFQATFLVLARKASSVQPRDRVANWLHGVALRTALKAKALTAKRRGREKQVPVMPEPEATPPGPWCDLLPLLDQELNGLPETYRLPILLCDLEGQTIREAAHQLGWPQGTLAGRLARARKMLAKRLANRGVELAGGVLAAVVSQNAASAAVPAALLRSTVQAAIQIAAGQAAGAGVVPAQVTILMEGVIKSMLLTKLTQAALAGLVVLCLCGLGMGGYQALPAQETKITTTTTTVTTTTRQSRPDPRLDGSWKQIRKEANGKVFPPLEGTITFACGRYQEGGVLATYTTAIDPKGERNEIDLTFTNGDRKGRKFYASYRIEGDTLHLISAGIPLAENLRRMTFSAPAGSPADYTVLQRVKTPQAAEQPQEEQKTRTPADVSTSAVAPSQAADKREYVITSKLVSTGIQQPKETLSLPRATVEEGQLVPISIIEVPQKLLEKVLVEEKIKLGLFLDMRVRRLAGTKVRLILSLQKNEVQESGVNGVSVLGNSVQAVQDVELRKPVKMVFEKDTRGSAQRWVEVAVDEITGNEQASPAPTASGPHPKGGKK
jgi:RNA polymerase sigma factor (sigma-70 family)